MSYVLYGLHSEVCMLATAGESVQGVALYVVLLVFLPVSYLEAATRLCRNYMDGQPPRDEN